jgi:hypothetical protein
MTAWDDLTPEERKAVGSLERLAARWPSSLMLFSWSGSLCVMRSDRFLAGDPHGAVITTIQGISNDGGDP